MRFVMVLKYRYRDIAISYTVS